MTMADWVRRGRARLLEAGWSQEDVDQCVNVATVCDVVSEMFCGEEDEVLEFLLSVGIDDWDHQASGF